jgi:hypothetical protein
MTSKDSAHDVSKEFAQAEGAEPWALGLCAVVCLFFGGHDDIPGRASREEVPSLTRLVIRVHGFNRFRNGLVIVDFPEMETIPIMYVYIYVLGANKTRTTHQATEVLNILEDWIGFHQTWKESISTKNHPDT